MDAAQEWDWVMVNESDALDIELSVSFPLQGPEYSRYPAKSHAEKVVSYLGVKDGLIFLPGMASKQYEDSDQEQPFRQRRHFFYLSGHNFPDCAVTYEIAANKLTLWIQHIDPKDILWYGRAPGIDDCLGRYNVDKVRYTSELDSFLSSVSPSTVIFALDKDQVPAVALRPRQKLNLTKLRPAIDEARVVKSGYEVAMIRQANKVSSEAHRRVAIHLLRLSNEREIAAIFQATCMTQGAKNLAYATIAGSGINAATLHYSDNDQALAPNQVVVLDAAAEWNCYASDITRTLPIHGFFTPEALDIYRVVEKMQEECIAKIKPGVLFFGLHQHAGKVALRELLALGVLRGEPTKIWRAGTVALFFPHGLGHHVGLEVHDVMGKERLLLVESPRPPCGKREIITPEMFRVPPPPYQGRRLLGPNMIVTIEPGIYFCREYIESKMASDPVHAEFIDKDVLERYYPVGGVRIEDDILVTDDGYENLSTAPKGEELLKLINGEP